MQIEWQYEHLDHSDALQEFAEKKLDRIDRRWGDRITRLRIFVSDINANKGGVDKHCTMEARVAGIDPVVAETMAADIYDAVKGAVDKLVHALEHAIDSRKAKRPDDQVPPLD